MNLAADRGGADVELEIDLRLVGPLETGRRVGVLDRQILDILRDHARGGAIVDAVGTGCGIGIDVGKDVAFVGHDVRSFVSVWACGVGAAVLVVCNRLRAAPVRRRA